MVYIKVLIFLFLVYLNGKFIVDGQLYEDESCVTDEGVEGVCTKLQLCQIAKDDLKNKNGVKPKICSFDKSVPIVCCLDPNLVPRPQRPQYQWPTVTTQGFGRPTQRPEQSFEQPQQPFEQPQQPQQTFEEPQQPFEQPQQTFEQPQINEQNAEQPSQEQQGTVDATQGGDGFNSQEQGELITTSVKPPRRQTQWWQKPKKTTPSP